MGWWAYCMHRSIPKRIERRWHASDSRDAPLSVCVWFPWTTRTRASHASHSHKIFVAANRPGKSQFARVKRMVAYIGRAPAAAGAGALAGARYLVGPDVVKTLMTTAMRKAAGARLKRARPRQAARHDRRGVEGLHRRPDGVAECPEHEDQVHPAHRLVTCRRLSSIGSITVSSGSSQTKRESMYLGISTLRHPRLSERTRASRKTRCTSTLQPAASSTAALADIDAAIDAVGDGGADTPGDRVQLAAELRGERPAGRKAAKAAAYRLSRVPWDGPSNAHLSERSGSAHTAVGAARTSAAPPQ